MNSGKKMGGRGIAISIDALLAMILTIAFIGFIGLGLQQDEAVTTTKATTLTTQAADDAFTAMDKSGFLGSALDSAETNNKKTDLIYAEATTVLPKNTGLRLKITEYTPTVGACKSAGAARTFSDCFPDTGKIEFPTKGDTIPADKEVLHGKKIQIVRQSVSAAGGGTDCQVDPFPIETIKTAEEKKSEEKVTASLAPPGEAQEILLKRKVEVNPSDYIRCDDESELPTTANHKMANVTAKMKDIARAPLAIMLAMDKSGSMATYDMSNCSPCTAPGCICTQGTCPDGTCQKKQNSFDNGTCSGIACATGNCPQSGYAGTGEHTGWLPVTSFDASTISGRVPAYGTPEAWTLNGFEYYFSNLKTGTDTCGSIPKMKVVAADGTTFYNWDSHYKNATNYYYYPTGYYPVEYVFIYNGEQTPHSLPPNYTWNVSAWTNKEITGGDNVRLNRELDVLKTLFSGSEIIPANGTPNGSYGECAPNLAEAEKIGEFTIPTLKDTVNQYIQYVGTTIYWDTGTYLNKSGCWPRLFIKKSGDPVPTCTATSCDAAQCTGSPCSDGHSITPSPTAVYEIYLWTDDGITLTQILGRMQVYDMQIMTYTTPLAPPKTSTCKDPPQVCSTSNCGNKTGWITGLDKFNIGDGNHLRGIKAVISGTNYGGVCKTENGVSSDYIGPKFRIMKGLEQKTEFSAEGTVSSPIPLPTGDYTLDGWADAPNMGFTVEWFLQRVDVAKKSAKAFIDNLDNDLKNLQWVPGSDMLGAVAYSDETDVQTLTDNRDVVKGFLDTLSPSDQTATADAIKEATDELKDYSGSTKVLILLTDGKANICLGGTACTPSGSPLSVENTAIEQAIAQADIARTNYHITIYVIGFAENMTGYDTQLKRLAKHQETSTDHEYCAVGEQYCGKYYYAANGNELQTIFDQIAGKIGGTIGPATISFPFPDGMDLINTASPGYYGVWDDEANGGAGGWVNTITTPQATLDNLSLSVGETNPKTLPPESWTADRRLELVPGTTGLQRINFIGRFWFAVQFDVHWLCSGPNCPDCPGVKTCSDEQYIVTLPPRRGAEETGVKGENVSDTILWGLENYKDVPFKYVDLKIKFLNGKIAAPNVKLDLKIENQGYYDVPLTVAKPAETTFYKEGAAQNLSCAGGCTLSPVGGQIQASGTILTLKDMTLCGLRGSTPCTPTAVSITNVLVNNTGYIKAELNEGKKIKECEYNNKATILCEPNPQFKFYTIDYYTWVK